MERFTGIIGIIFILFIAFLCSNNKRKINLRLVLSGLGLQFLIAVLILRVGFIRNIFIQLGEGMKMIDHFAKAGVNFIYGGVGAVAPNGDITNFTEPGAFVF